MEENVLLLDVTPLSLGIETLWWCDYKTYREKYNHTYKEKSYFLLLKIINQAVNIVVTQGERQTCKR